MAKTRSLEKRGVRHAGAMISQIAANTSVTAYIIPPTRVTTNKIVKIVASNRTGADVQLRFGITIAGPAFSQLMPDIRLVNGFDTILTARDIPQVEFTSDIVCQVSNAAAAPNNVQVLIEVEEVR